MMMRRGWSGVGGVVEARVGASECGDRIDRVMGSIFGVGRKSPAAVVVGGWPEMGREGEKIESVCSGKGFQIRGRELLSLDGAFMRGQYPGQMLTVVGVDANNGIYPVAYGIVESENQYS
ncbi:FAR1-related sequence 10 [Tanacetum coccineum]